MSPSALATVGATGVAVGLINALSGGGSLLSFPLLTGLGLPVLVANATNSVALSPGYGGAALAQYHDLRGQGKRMALLLPVAALGGLVGGWLLVSSGERLFRAVVPWLILLGALLLAGQQPLRQRLFRRRHQGQPPHEAWSVAPLFLASIYGGYFGAGLSVIVLAVLGIFVEDTLPRLNGLKQAIALAANLSAALLFMLLGRVAWSAALILALGAIAGGVLGGRLANRIDPEALRWLVVVISLGVAVAFFLTSARS